MTSFEVNTFRKYLHLLGVTFLRCLNRLLILTGFAQMINIILSFIYLNGGFERFMYFMIKIVNCHDMEQKLFLFFISYLYFKKHLYTDF